MRRAGVCLIFVSVLLLVACATDSRHPEAPSPSLALEGFSFSPPKAADWRQIQRTPHWVALARQGTVPDESYAVQAMLLRLPRFDNDEAFLAYSINAIDNDTDLGRFKMLYNDDRLVAGRHGSCVRYVLKARDSDPLTASDRHTPMVLEIVSFICRHPDNPEFGVNLSYSKRYYPGGTVEDLMPDATGMFDSLRFTSLARVEAGALTDAESKEE